MTGLPGVEGIQVGDHNFTEMKNQTKFEVAMNVTYKVRIQEPGL